MSDDDGLLDLVIVGAGPAGIALGAEAVAAGISPARVLILERGEAHSFSIRKFYPESKLVTANYKGLPAVCTGVLCLTDASKGETLTYLDRAIEDNGLIVRYREAVGAIRPRTGLFLIETTATTYRSKTCVVAIGILGRPQKPDWPIPSSLKARITYDITSVTLRKLDVLVVGGGDSASEYAQYLVQEDCRVVLSYRGSSFHRMNDINRTSLAALEEQGRVLVLGGTNIARVESDGGRPRVHFTDDKPKPGDLRPRRPRARRHHARELPQDDRDRLRRPDARSARGLRNLDSRPLSRRRSHRGKDRRLDHLGLQLRERRDARALRRASRLSDPAATTRLSRVTARDFR